MSELDQILSPTFRKHLNTIIKQFTFEKNSKFSSETYFYSILNKITNRLSFAEISTHFFVNDEYPSKYNYTSISKSALIKATKRQNILVFNKINDDLLNFIYKDNKPRILAVDGTYVHPNKIINDKLDKCAKLPLTTTKHECKMLVSTIYDIENEITLNHTSMRFTSERLALQSQLCYIKPNDILIMDRGYFSHELVRILFDNKIQFLFRIKTNSVYAKQLRLNKKCNFNYTHKKIVRRLRCVKYKIDDKDDYYLLTNILNITVKYAKELYRKRWCIETEFKHQKYSCGLDNLVSKSFDGVRKEIAIHTCASIINGYMLSNIRKSDEKNTKTMKYNKKVCGEIINSEIIKIILQIRSTTTQNVKRINGEETKELMHQINQIKKTAHVPKPNRHYPRISKQRRSKWNTQGSMTKQLNKYRKTKQKDEISPTNN